MSTTKRQALKITGRKRPYPINVEIFDSAEEVVEAGRQRPFKGSPFDDMKTEHYRDWHGCGSYDEALELMRVGYQPTVEELRKSFKITKSGERARFSFNNSIVGFAPVVPLAMMGVPNNMINMTMTPIKTKVIDVYYDMTASAAISSKQIIDAGRQILAAIIELEKQGYRFNIYATQTYSDSNDADMLVVKVKSAGRPIDLKRISVPLTHTSFFRVIGFDWYSKFPTSKHRSCYGHAIGYEFNSREIKEMSEQLFGRSAIYMSASSIIRKDKNYIEGVLTNGECKTNKR